MGNRHLDPGIECFLGYFVVGLNRIFDKIILFRLIPLLGLNVPHQIRLYFFDPNEFLVNSLDMI